MTAPPRHPRPGALPRPPRALLLALLALLVCGVPPAADAVDAAAIAMQITDARCGPDYDPCARPADADDPLLYCDYSVGPVSGGYCQACGGEPTSFCNGLEERLTDEGFDECLEQCAFKPCADECATGEFCSFYNYGEVSNCQSCANLIVHPDNCAAGDLRLPDEGVAACEETCPGRACGSLLDCSSTDPSTKYFCDYAPGGADLDPAVPAGTCAPCADLAAVEECTDRAASELGAAECAAVCEAVIVTSCAVRVAEDVPGLAFYEAEVDGAPYCRESQFCNSDVTCEVCPGVSLGYLGWHAEECFGPAYFDDYDYDYVYRTDAAARSCADACRTVCLVMTDSIVAVADLDVAYGVKETLPMYNTVARDVSGPLVDCQLGGIGECPPDAPPDFVCLVERGARAFVDKAINCERAGGIGVVMYDNQEVGMVEGTLGDAPLGISMTAMSQEDGVYLRENALGLETTLNVKVTSNECETGCSDRMACPGADYCEYQLGNGTMGHCRKCQEDEDAARKECFLSGLSLKGAQECAAACDSALFASSCKVCGQGVSGDVLRSATPDQPKCDFCPGGMAKAVGDRVIPFMGNDATCEGIYQFFENYDIAEDNPNCQLALGFNYICDCAGPGYAGARTLRQRRALVWVPRATALMSVLGSASIIVDVARDHVKRKKPYGQLMVVMSAFDLVGSLAYALTSLPIPAEYGVEGAHGNDASCKAQGFFIQMGTIAAFINVSLAAYYFCVIQLAWGDTAVMDLRHWFFIVPIVLGLAFACAGIPFYGMLFLWCNNSANVWPDIPVALAILATTGIMSSICYDVWKTDQASKRGRMDADDGPQPQTMSSRMFWQSVWYLLAFWLTWVPYLALQYTWAAGQGYSSYAFTLFACAVVPLQGCSNAIVYFRRRAKKRANEMFSQVRHRLSSTGEVPDAQSTSTGFAARLTSRFRRKSSTAGASSTGPGASAGASSMGPGVSKGGASSMGPGVSTGGGEA